MKCLAGAFNTLLWPLVGPEDSKGRVIDRPLIFFNSKSRWNGVNALLIGDAVVVSLELDMSWLLISMEMESLGTN